MSIQKWLAEVLADVLTAANGWVIKPYPFVPDNGEPGKRYVAVYRNSVTPGPNTRSRQHELQIVLMSGAVEPSNSDEDLAEPTDELLDLIDTDPDLNGVMWTQVQRGVEAQAYPSMTVDITVYSTNQES